MELTSWKLPNGSYTMKVTVWNLHHGSGSYFMELTQWKLPQGTYIMEVT